MTSSTVQETRERLTQIFIRDAYFRQKIVLSSGKESDYYVDARLITLQPEGVLLTAQLILEEVKADQLDAIGGPTLGADPMIGALGVLSFQAGKPLNTFIIRQAAKAHGRQKQVEGPFLTEGSRVAIIDDVATTGKAFLHSIEVLRDMKVEIVKAICIVDRQEGAREALQAKGVELVSLLSIHDIHTPNP